MRAAQSHLPIDDILPELTAALHGSRRVILSASPGAGKTTRVPPALLDSGLIEGKKIIMLEPRRLAARRAAEYMAEQRREPLGQTIGYRIRGDAVVGKSTRIEVVTEGILTRMLHDDASLAGTGLVIFDEFHERSLNADLGLALVLDVQQHLRDDLHILVMSATLDGISLQAVMPDAVTVRSEGRMFPVETHYARFASEKPIDVRMAETILRALAGHEGDVLAFLPGRREIFRTEQALAERRLPSEVQVHLLYGDAPVRQQQAALTPAPSGRRKIILATNIAETSLTIDGVSIVVDSGLARTARFDPRRGMAGLVTVPISQASADQRRGRAGRLGPGTCFRLWRESENESRPAFTPPEIKTSDLAHLALDLARWGDPSGESLRFIDPPPSALLSQARSLLRELGALDHSGALTTHGRSMSDLPIHPRFAHMIIRAQESGSGALACTIAAVLEERDFAEGRERDNITLSTRLQDLDSDSRPSASIRDRIRDQAARLRRMMNLPASSREWTDTEAGLLLALAYPDRIARRRKTGDRQYRLSNGTSALLPAHSLLVRHEFLSVADVDGAGEQAKIFLAAPLEETDIRRAFPDLIEAEEILRWDTQQETIVARSVERLGAVILGETEIVPRGEQLALVVADAVRAIGMHALPWSNEARAFQERSEWLRQQGMVPDSWPDLSDEQLLRTLHTWLGRALASVRRKSDLARIPLFDGLKRMLTHAQLAELERLAPAQVRLPTGTHGTLNYGGAQPVLAVKLQELFGQVETPRIAGGRVPLLLHLLSPASRPLAVTQDLRSFWIKVYPEIRKQMRARYPKHVWPEDPLTARPTNRTRRRS